MWLVVVDVEGHENRRDGTGSAIAIEEGAMTFHILDATGSCKLHALGPGSLLEKIAIYFW